MAWPDRFLSLLFAPAPAPLRVTHPAVWWRRIDHPKGPRRSPDSERSEEDYLK